MKNNNLGYENYMMACLGDLEERWRILRGFKTEIEDECGSDNNLKMTILLDMENSFDEIDEAYFYFRKNLFK